MGRSGLCVLILLVASAMVAQAGIKDSTADLVEAASRLNGSIRANGFAKSSSSELAVKAALLEASARRLDKAVWENRPPAQLAQYIRKTAALYYEVGVLSKQALTKEGARAFRNFEFEFEKTGENFSEYAYMPFQGYR